MALSRTVSEKQGDICKKIPTPLNLTPPRMGLSLEFLTMVRL